MGPVVAAEQGLFKPVVRQQSGNGLLWHFKGDTSSDRLETNFCIGTEPVFEGKPFVKERQVGAEPERQRC